MPLCVLRFAHVLSRITELKKLQSSQLLFVHEIIWNLFSLCSSDSALDPSMFLHKWTTEIQCSASIIWKSIANNSPRIAMKRNWIKSERQHGKITEIEAAIPRLLPKLYKNRKNVHPSIHPISMPLIPLPLHKRTKEMYCNRTLYHWAMSGQRPVETTQRESNTWPFECRALNKDDF